MSSSSAACGWDFAAASLASCPTKLLSPAAVPIQVTTEGCSTVGSHVTKSQHEWSLSGNGPTDKRLRKEREKGGGEKKVVHVAEREPLAPWPSSRTDVPLATAVRLVVSNTSAVYSTEGITPSRFYFKVALLRTCPIKHSPIVLWQQLLYRSSVSEQRVSMATTAEVSNNHKNIAFCFLLSVFFVFYNDRSGCEEAIVSAASLRRISFYYSALLYFPIDFASAKKFRDAAWFKVTTDVERLGHPCIIRQSIHCAIPNRESEMSTRNPPAIVELPRERRRHLKFKGRPCDHCGFSPPSLFLAANGRFFLSNRNSNIRPDPVLLT